MKYIFYNKNIIIIVFTAPGYKDESNMLSN